MTDGTKSWATTKIGNNGKDLFSFDVYLQEKQGNKYTAEFWLYIVMTGGKMDIHTQEFGVTKKEWPSVPSPASASPAPSEQAPAKPPAPPKPAREYISLDFVDLQKRISQLNGVQAQRIADLYLGKWVKTKGVVGSISVVTGAQMIMVFPPWVTPPPETSIVFVFDKEWESEIGALKAGDTISVDCQIDTLESGRVKLFHCELTGIIATDQPAASPPSPKRPASPPKR